MRKPKKVLNNCLEIIRIFIWLIIVKSLDHIWLNSGNLTKAEENLRKSVDKGKFWVKKKKNEAIENRGENKLRKCKSYEGDSYKLLRNLSVSKGNLQKAEEIYYESLRVSMVRIIQMWPLL